MRKPTTRIASALFLVGAALAPAMSHGAPAPAPCPADFNHDGRLNINDYMEYHAAYRRADPRADFDGNGTVDIRDAVNFRAAFAHGC